MALNHFVQGSASGIPGEDNPDFVKIPKSKSRTQMPTPAIALMRTMKKKWKRPSPLYERVTDENELRYVKSGFCAAFDWLNDLAVDLD